MDQLRKDAEAIVSEAIDTVRPGPAIRRALQGWHPGGRVYLAAVGKAAWEMANAARDCLEVPVEDGIVLTKYGHVPRPLTGVRCFEAGHPLPDGNTLRGTREILNMTASLSAADTVLFLLSGGGSALFESPLIPLDELQDITGQLLACGADIRQINTVRKRLSAVKGGRFAQWCAPARVRAVILSDVLGDRPDMIASGPTAADPSTCREALEIARHLRLSPEARVLLEQETPKVLDHVQNQIIGSVGQLCAAAAEACRRRGYRSVMLTDCMDCEAREAGRFLAAVLRSHVGRGEKLAFLAGGETVVHVTGSGLGGRNQELALAAAGGISGLRNAAVISVGSDGTDGPTDAAGGYADGGTLSRLREKGMVLEQLLEAHDSYHGLQAAGGLIFTGPTGTNVNDIAIGLIAP